ncbi:MAG TPA: hypothetical protein P5511_08470 [Candidatus Goldiibacteriota bacterium]|nr:hypothetical protein [Candidatus Goldiibacteriota bacterium]
MRKRIFMSGGQAVTEYVLVIACVALACFASAKLFHAALAEAYRRLALILMLPIP